MLEQLSEWLNACARQFSARDMEDRYDEHQALRDAHRDWVAAQRLFDYASDPELVDYAIYSLKAAEKQFVYLWKRARTGA